MPEVLRSEVDASGYDVVVECNGFLRHIQLKCSKDQGKTSSQKVNVVLASKPSGCVVWVIRHEDHERCRMRFDYLFFGGNAGQQLPPLDGFKIAKHTKPNGLGVKTSRAAIRVVPKKHFEKISDMRELLRRLFELEQPAGSN